jgi:hypothetical protein
MSLKQVAIACDQLGNTLLGGYADETMSARAYRLSAVSRSWNLTRRIIDVIFFWDTCHCKASHLAELERKQLPGAYRGTENWTA